jgi:hypothetical protein
MKSALIALCLCLCFCSLLLSDPCVPGTLSTYEALGSQGCTVGDLTFSNFSGLASNGSDVSITPFAGPFGGIASSGAFSGGPPSNGTFYRIFGDASSMSFGYENPDGSETVTTIPGEVGGLTFGMQYSAENVPPNQRDVYDASVSYTLTDEFGVVYAAMEANVGGDEFLGISDATGGAPCSLGVGVAAADQGAYWSSCSLAQGTTSFGTTVEGFVSGVFEGPQSIDGVTVLYLDAPEPGTGAGIMLGIGLGILAAWARRRAISFRSPR